MLDPFTYWTRAMTISLDMAKTLARASETAVASRDVIDQRTDTIESAVRDPLHADIAELVRMVPEKVAAFSQAGVALIDGWVGWNHACAAEAQHLSAMAMRGRLPTPGEWMALATRVQTFALASAERGASVGAATLKPVHAKAVSNARRLGRRRKR